MARSPPTPRRSDGLLGGGGFHDLSALYRDMNRLFDENLGGGPTRGNGGGTVDVIGARMDVSETESEVRVAAALPGVTEGDIDVSLDDDVLTVRGEKTFEFVRRGCGTVLRSVRLPCPVDPERARARFENGVLTVTLPKMARAERAWRIPLRRGRAAQEG